MLKILILRGIPGAGKSTWAREFIKDNSEKWVIVNRDSIRDMLGNYWVPNREGLVTDIEESMVHHAKLNNYNVIVDATNINKKTVKKNVAYFKMLGFEVEFKDFKIDVEVAIERDKNRERTVGEKVIRSFYNRLKQI